MSVKDAQPDPKSAQLSQTDAKTAEQLEKAEQDDLLVEALEESFPASDPMSSMHFTPDKPKPQE
jgi:hypothetical protein